MISVDQLSEEQALSLLCTGLSKIDIEAHRTFLLSLVRRSDRCALLLELANGRLWALGRDKRGAIIDQVENEFGFGGVTEFDSGEHPSDDLSSPEKRDEVFTNSISASLALLGQQETRRFLELAIFPEATVPYALVAFYWAETASMEDGAASDLLNRLKRMGLVKSSLVEDIDPVTKCESLKSAIRIDNVVRAYARDPMWMSPHTLVSLNRRFCKAYIDADKRAFAEGTALARYISACLPWHLVEAGETGLPPRCDTGA